MCGYGMQFKLGERFARCPYCGSIEFVAAERSPSPPRELVCARCGGFASRKVVLDNLRAAAEARPDQGRSDER